MKTLAKALRVIGLLLCALGCLWFLLPLLHGGFRLGAVFGFCVCLFGFFLLLLYRKGVKRGGWRKILARVLSALYGVGVCWALYLSALMISAQYHAPPKGIPVIVLGAQVYSAERMGVSLSNRVDKAYEYLKENPGSPCIVTGGQGDDEPCPEAVTEKNALTRMGIEPDRIYMEDRSRNTRENMAFAMEIAQREGLGTQAAVVTQGFHLYRALKLAESTGFTAYGLKADTDPLLLPEYYGRELLSLTKWHIERITLE